MTGTGERKAGRARPLGTWARACRFAFMLFTLLGGLERAASAQEYLPKLGGSGGSQFDTRCPLNESLIGVELRAGDWIDAIRPLCAVVLGPREIAPSRQSGMPWSGGPGGGIVRVVCPTGTPIVKGLYALPDGENIHTIITMRLYCGTTATAQIALATANPSAIFDSPYKEGYWYEFVAGFAQQCPPGQMAAGIHGKAGSWLDAVGLFCSPPVLDTSRPPPKLLGKVHTAAARPAGDICAAARAARARGNPAAPSLEARCRAIEARAAASAYPIKALGRVLPANAPPSQLTICEAAAAARARNSPATPSLEARCRAFQGRENAAAAPPPEPDPIVEPAPEPDPEPGPGRRHARS